MINRKTKISIILWGFFNILFLSFNTISADLSDLGWKIPQAMVDDADPEEMNLYLTLDTKLIWVKNNIADRLGRKQRHPIKSKSDLLNYELGMIRPYTSIISYANVDFKNIKTKQEKNILHIVKEVFAHQTFYTLNKTKKEIKELNIKNSYIRDFTIQDVEILKKENNMCILFNQEVINPYYNLKKVIYSLEKKGFSNYADEEFIKMNEQKKSKD